MQAPVSRAVGGVKSIFLWPFDWIFRRDGAGAIVPIEIDGTLKQPEVGISIRRAFGGKPSKKAGKNTPSQDFPRQ
jgi:hypothetical protein